MRGETISQTRKAYEKSYSRERELNILLQRFERNYRQSYFGEQVTGSLLSSCYKTSIYMFCVYATESFGASVSKVLSYPSYKGLAARIFEVPIPDQDKELNISIKIFENQTEQIISLFE